MVNFTETTDKLESEDLTNVLNRYLTEMSDIALEHGATIDKYIGDAIMVFFGDPESKGVKEDARACVRMAIAMLRRLRELQAEWQELGAEKPFHLRVGINTGYVTVGNFGSDDRMDYTIIGSSVNLTARLQSHSEIDGILLGHETYSLVKDEVAVEEQTPIKVKGFAEPVRCYKVLGLYDDLASEGSRHPRGEGRLQGPARFEEAWQGRGRRGARGDRGAAQGFNAEAVSHLTGTGSNNEAGPLASLAISALTMFCADRFSAVRRHACRRRNFSSAYVRARSDRPERHHHQEAFGHRLRRRGRPLRPVRAFCP